MKTFLIVDGHSLAHRGYHAIHSDLSSIDGTPTSMIVGFMNMLYKVQDNIRPDCTVIAFDAGGKTFRHELAPDYKANRVSLDDNFRLQLSLLQDLLTFSGHKVISQHGVEADDLVASFVKLAQSEGHEVTILSSDKDLLQLLSPEVTLMRPVKRGIVGAEVYSVESFKAEYNFMPSSMGDYLAILGDSTDNIKGIAGIGAKGAKELLAQYSTLENIFASLDQIPKRLRTKLEESGSEQPIWTRDNLIRLKDNIFDGDKNLLRECLELRLDFKKAEELAERLDLGRVLERIGSSKETLYSDIRTAEIIMPDCEIFTYDYKQELRENPGLFNTRKIWDLKTAYYLLHPDVTGKRFARVIADIKAHTNNAEFFHERAGRYNARILEHKGLSSVMNDIDLPLIPVLNQMEDRGVRLDPEKFQSIKHELETKIFEIDSDIEAKSGLKININSPSQVSWLLFDRLGFVPDTLTKGKKVYSTDANVLEKLSRQPGGEIPGLILEYRELSKMLSGFVVPFMNYASRDGIIHTTFEPAFTGTGRLSSRDPNLQNIPAFGHWAEKIKSGLVPVNPDNVFVSADYSQIELRVLAYMSGEERLIEAFKNKRDIHTETASWVFDTAPEFVTPELRRAAKMINFGLLYGMSTFGLAERLNISRDEAKNIMTRYFDALPGLQKFLDRIVNEAKERGFSRTISGRIRQVREIPAKGAALDRALINSPIQGTAADIARKAMVNFESEQGGKLFLQVHDSLVCECAESEADEIAESLSEIMIKSGGKIEHLEVQTKRGKNLSHV